MHRVHFARLGLPLLAMTALLFSFGFPGRNGPEEHLEIPATLAGTSGWSVHAKNGETPKWVLDLMKAHSPNEEVVQSVSAGWWI